MTDNKFVVSPFFRDYLRCVISGPSFAGKSELCAKIVRERKTLFQSDIQRIFWFNTTPNAIPNLTNVLNIEKTYLHDPEDLEQIVTTDSIRNSLLIIDDALFTSDKLISEIFTKLSHHYGFHVIIIMQNLFPRTKYSRTISLNANTLILFKNARDLLQIRTLAQQLNPSNASFILDAYKRATLLPFTYLVVDLYQDTPEQLRYRGSLFPSAGKYIVYVPKK